MTAFDDDSFSSRGWVKTRIAGLAELLVDAYRMSQEIVEAVANSESDARGVPEYLNKAFLIPLVCSEIPEFVGHGVVQNYIEDHVLKGGPIFCWPWKIARSLPPNEVKSAAYAGVHQDFMELQGGVNQVVVWIPLHGVDKNSGTLPVYDWSLDRGVCPIRLDESSHSGFSCEPAALGKPNYPALERGEVLVFSNTTPHGGSINYSSTWRYSLELRYQYCSEPICEDFLNPPPHSASWSSYFENKEQYFRYWDNLPLETFEFDLSWELWRNLLYLTSVQGGAERSASLDRIVDRSVQEMSESINPFLRHNFARLLG